VTTTITRPASHDDLLVLSAVGLSTDVVVFDSLSHQAELRGRLRCEWRCDCRISRYAAGTRAGGAGTVAASARGARPRVRPGVAVAVPLWRPAAAMHGPTSRQTGTDSRNQINSSQTIMWNPSSSRDCHLERVE
jgi:hypothetical protein